MRIIDFLDNSPAMSQNESRFIDLESDVSLSYQDMANISHRVAVLLKDKGVNPGDVVATYAPNSVAAYACIFAISRTGAIWLPLNMKNTLEDNLKLVVKAKATTIFIDEGLFQLAPKITEHFAGIRLIPLSGGKIDSLELSGLAKRRVNIDEGQSSPWAAADSGEVVSLFATGGTTGDSKLAEWSGLTWESMAKIQIKLMPEPDIPAAYLVSAPMTHAAGVSSFATILQGASIIVMEGMIPERLIAAIETYRVTHLFLPPTAIYMLLTYESVRERDYSSLRYFWYAAAPMSVEKLKQAVEIFGPVMVQSYGQAEAPMLCAFLAVEDHLSALKNHDYSKLRSCGKAPPMVQLAILDDEGNPLSAGQEGEIAVKGNLLMRGYHDNKDATNEIRTQGWQRTGDVGVLDRDGFLFIVDRKKDMIISGGFNVYPSEIEQLLWGHPAINDCAVIGIPHDKWGEQVTAVIELKSKDNMPDLEELIQYCKKNLGSVKAPKEILIWDALPRSPVGKVLKKEIRSAFWNQENRKI